MERDDYFIQESEWDESKAEVANEIDDDTLRDEVQHPRMESLDQE